MYVPIVILITGGRKVNKNPSPGKLNDFMRTFFYIRVSKTEFFLDIESGIT